MEFVFSVSKIPACHLRHSIIPGLSKKKKTVLFCFGVCFFFFFNFDKAGQHPKPTHHGDPAHGRELELDDILGLFQRFPMVLK